MPSSFVITSATIDTLKLDAKGRAQGVFTVTNNTTRSIRGLARAKALGDTKQQWLSIEGEAERDFASGATEQFTVTFDAPVTPSPKGDTVRTGDTRAVAGSAAGTGASGDAPAKKYPFRLDVSSAVDPDEYSEQYQTGDHAE